MKKNNTKIYALLALLFISLNSFSQLYGGIEIGSKGIKMSVLDVDNIRKGRYEIKSFWTENVGIAKGIAIDGNLADDDIEKAVAVVLLNYDKLKKEFKVEEDNIFIVGSSGVAMAKNTTDLIEKIKTAVNKKLDFIDAQTEAKMLLKGCVPPIDYINSIVLDIGGGNTKGGYVDVGDNENFVFFPVSLNYGSITLTEAVNKKVTKKNDLGEYVEKSFTFLPILREQINAMYSTAPLALEKEKIFMSGGAVWAFYTLSNGLAKQAFNEFKLEDVIYYDAILKNNFQKFETLAETDKEAQKVLKVYSQKHLISGSNILQASLEAIPNLDSKKLFFAKDGQIAWLVSYIAERSRRVKKID